MIGVVIARIAGSPLARAVASYAATAFAMLLFLLALRRSGERAGRLAERSDTMEKARGAQQRDA